MKDYQRAMLDEILKITSQNTSDRHVVYLEGGYFDSRFGPQEFSTNTLDGCLEIAETIIKKPYSITRVLLGILVNNIGIACGEDACIIPSQNSEVKNDEDLEIPDILQKRLNKSKLLKKDQVIFSNEKTLRNRGIRMIKVVADDQKKYSLSSEAKQNGDEICSITIDGKKIPLAIKRGKTWSARCPLIMGQHYIDLIIKIAKKYGNSTHQLLVDMSEMYDRHKVNNGAKVALHLLERLYGYDVKNFRIANISFQDDELDLFELDLIGG